MCPTGQLISALMVYPCTTQLCFASQDLEWHHISSFGMIEVGEDQGASNFDSCCTTSSPSSLLVLLIQQMKAILHAADISTPIRPFTSALASAERLHKEFQQQAQRERELNLPVAPHMDADEVAVWAKMEVQFIDYVAGPLWERMGQVSRAASLVYHKLQVFAYVNGACMYL